MTGGFVYWLYVAEKGKYPIQVVERASSQILA